MQQWEYKTLFRSRGWASPKDPPKAPYLEATRWDVDISQKLVELGDEGWELVTVTSRSDYLGGKEGTNAYNLALDFAGWTSNELWVFKRPKG